MIIGLGHQARVGKDTLANLLVERHGFQRLAFADKLKELAYETDPLVYGGGTGHLQEFVDTEGWEAAKAHPEVRRYLQFLGTGARKVLGPNIWVDSVLDKIRDNPEQDYVITDVRFPNEFEALQDEGAYLIKLIRDDAPVVAGHISETALIDAEWDYIVPNNGTPENLLGTIVRLVGLS